MLTDRILVGLQHPFRSSAGVFYFIGKRHLECGVPRWAYVVYISSDEVGSTKCAKQVDPGRDGLVNECFQRFPRYVFDYAGNDIAPKAGFLGGQSLLNSLPVVCLDDRYIRKNPASAVGAI